MHTDDKSSPSASNSVSRIRPGSQKEHFVLTSLDFPIWPGKEEDFKVEGCRETGVLRCCGREYIPSCELDELMFAVAPDRLPRRGAEDVTQNGDLLAGQRGSIIGVSQGMPSSISLFTRKVLKHESFLLNL